MSKVLVRVIPSKVRDGYHWVLIEYMGQIVAVFAEPDEEETPSIDPPQIPVPGQH